MKMLDWRILGYKYISRTSAARYAMLKPNVSFPHDHRVPEP
jgi:hypothetical protein